MDKSESGNERFFVAIIPPLEIAKKITSIKEHFSETYGSRAALRSPPHITLVMPFFWQTKKEEILIDEVEGLANSLEPFELELEDFGSFAPKVVFVQVLPNSSLSEAQRGIVLGLRERLNINHPNSNNRTFHPHVTVAFRDLRKAKFHEAWREFQTRAFKEAFRAEAIALLRHNGKRWEIYREFPFSSI